MPENETVVDNQVEQQETAVVKSSDAVLSDYKDDNAVVSNSEQHRKTLDTEVKDEQVSDDTKNDKQNETNETKIGTFETIKNTIKNIVKGNADGTADTDADVGGDEIALSEQGEDIPEDFTKAALDADWTEQQIKKHSSDYSDDELRKQIPYLDTSSVDSDKSEQPAKKDDVVVEKKDEQVKDDVKDEVIAKLTERLDKLEKGQEKNIERDSQERLQSMASRATQLMDEQSKEFEVFGTFDKLPRFPDGRIIPNSPQNEARNEVWGLALNLESTGIDFEQALSTSLNAYKGKNLANDVKRNLVKSYKKAEKRLSPKRSSHEQVKTGLSGPDVIREVGKKHGIDIP